MRKRDRIITALDHEEPDTVPITELSIDPGHVETITGTKINTGIEPPKTSNRREEENSVNTIVSAYLKVGFDLIPCEESSPDGWAYKRNPDGTVVDEWGRILSFDTNSRVWVQTDGTFKSVEEFEAFELPDPNEPGRTFALEKTKRKIGEEIALAGVIRDSFAYAWEMFRVTDFVRWLYGNPAFLRRVIEEITDFNVEIAKRMVDAGVDLIIGDGDYCEKRGPLVPVKFFNDVILPNLRRQVEVAHKAGLKFIKHTDGNINPLLPDLATVVDGLHSLDPSAGVNLGDVKRLYGDKLVLMGNVSVDNLCRGSVQDIVDETKNCLLAAAQGGGYVLSSSNSWYTNAKLKNCLAMVETGRKHGRYPIGIA